MCSDNNKITENSSSSNKQLLVEPCLNEAVYNKAILGLVRHIQYTKVYDARSKEPVLKFIIRDKTYAAVAAAAAEYGCSAEWVWHKPVDPRRSHVRRSSSLSGQILTPSQELMYTYFIVPKAVQEAYLLKLAREYEGMDSTNKFYKKIEERYLEKRRQHKGNEKVADKEAQVDSTDDDEAPKEPKRPRRQEERQLQRKGKAARPQMSSEQSGGGLRTTSSLRPSGSRNRKASRGAGAEHTPGHRYLVKTVSLNQLRNKAIIIANKARDLGARALVSGLTKDLDEYIEGVEAVNEQGAATMKSFRKVLADVETLGDAASGSAAANAGYEADGNDYDYESETP
uniref:Uncharacterized protein n=1 Tax=Mycena chlorophos TaxID=658473 RepID=A0ABQ0LTZ1_MYCCL|nr:predicted protein [Mycena chlorophos]